MVWVNMSGSRNDSSGFTQPGKDTDFAFGRKQYQSPDQAINEWRMRGYGTNPDVRWYPLPGESPTPPPEHIERYNRAQAELSQASGDAGYRMYEAEQRRQEEQLRPPQVEQRPGEVGIVREGEIIQTPERRIQSDNRGGYIETRYNLPQYHATRENPEGLGGQRTLPKIPLFEPKTGKPNVRYEGEAPPPEFKRDAKYGLMKRADLVQPVLPTELNPTINASNYYFLPIAQKGQAFTEKSARYVKEKIGYSQNSNVVKKFAVGVAEGVLSLPEYGATIALGAETVIRNRDKVKTVAQAAGGGAVLTFGGLAKGAETKPAETLGMLFATKKLSDYGVRMLSASPVKAGKVSIPTAKAEIPLWRGIFTDVKQSRPVVGLGQSVAKIRTQLFTPLKDTIRMQAEIRTGTPISRLSVKPGEISKPNIIIGQPKASQLPSVKAGDIQTGYLPKSGIETTIITSPVTMKRFGFLPAEIEKAQVGKELVKLTEKQKSAFINKTPRVINLFGKQISLGNKKSLIYESGTLPEIGVRETIQFTKSYSPFEMRQKEFFGRNIKVPSLVMPTAFQIEKVMGSFSARPQMPKELQRIPNDIDIHTTGTQAQALKLAERLQVRLEKQGIKSKIAGTTIETEVLPGKYAHAVQFLSKDMFASGEVQATHGWQYGFKVDQTPIKIERAKIARLSEQSVRKFTAAMQFREGRLMPPEHRIKDIGDAYAVGKTLVSSMEFNLIPNAQKIQRGNQLLLKWKSLYPEVDWGAIENTVIKAELKNKPFLKIKLPMKQAVAGTGYSYSSSKKSSDNVRYPYSSENVLRTARDLYNYAPAPKNDRYYGFYLKQSKTAPYSINSPLSGKSKPTWYRRSTDTRDYSYALPPSSANYFRAPGGGKYTRLAGKAPYINLGYNRSVIIPPYGTSRTVRGNKTLLYGTDTKPTKPAKTGSITGRNWKLVNPFLTLFGVKE